ncbi:ABC transporter substrate-binding protein [Mucilaginibacter sp. BT774]|uniref:ABC transporter substrate-binding protein n=1 Tax=Mucilaginibacter sp. BT774 TaxID=3062276 RepID=UPI002676A6B0|nr:helical backbone metal receptor [Mucilaginibacter sp. BT774]MDO3625319.1 helical backbone metal receptor [Mucilaginibacter sp. BT774]
MPLYTDQMNRMVDIPSPPKRIISIVPSQTELLFDLGLEEEIIGVTKFCIHPADKVKRKLKVGGTKKLNINQIKKLNPDLIIGNKEENEKDQIEELMEHFPVWMSDISNLGDAVSMIRKVGELVGREEKADLMAATVSDSFDNLKIKSSSLKVAYLIWRKPYIVAGKGTFIDDMLKKCGLKNAFEQERYPEVFPAQIVEANPDLVLLSSEPYPFTDRHITEFQALVPDSNIQLVDGELFSWYGSRLLQAPEYFKQLISSLNR